MSITAVVPCHNYARYLPACLESALQYCDEVLVYDDGSTDRSEDVARAFGVPVTRREDASGSPVWGSNLGIRDATSTHIVFLDADNYLLAPPPQTDADYTFADLYVCDEGGTLRDLWAYAGWPLTAEACMARFRSTRSIPFPSGGVWRSSFAKQRAWREFDSTPFAADFRTAIDWCADNPTLAYSPRPFLAFRSHAGQGSGSPERAVMYEEVCALTGGNQ